MLVSHAVNTVEIFFYIGERMPIGRSGFDVPVLVFKLLTTGSTSIVDVVGFSFSGT